MSYGKQIKVTQAGMALLYQRKQKLMDDLKYIVSQKGEAAEVGGDEWHDNFAFEDLVRQEDMVSKRISDVSDEISRAVVVDMPKQETVLAVGHIATLEYEDGTERHIEVAGYGEGDLKAIPLKLDYTAPLVAPFVGHEIEMEAYINLGGESHLIVLTEIQSKGG